MLAAAETLISGRNGGQGIIDSVGDGGGCGLGASPGSPAARRAPPARSTQPSTLPGFPTSPLSAEAPPLPGDSHPFQLCQSQLISQAASGPQRSTSKALAWTMRAQEACHPIKRSSLRGLLFAGGGERGRTQAAGVRPPSAPRTVASS